MTLPSWKDTLGDRIPPHLEDEIGIFETQLELKRQDKIDDKIFAETRLRRGVYGQRYDNGFRHDGSESRPISYPSDELTKGPTTMWDAPGMQRIKIPFGGLDSDQLEVLSDLAEEYSDAILHVTTRQDFQLHFIHIEDTPDLMRRLAAVGITTLEACGNTVRNVTACPKSGVCADEAFDVSPYARALATFLLGHKDAQDFGRKFKISFSGCGGAACGLAHMHDLGVVAATRKIDGAEVRGFEVYVGGGLGAVPHQAALFDDFLAEDELLPTAQAICRVFARLGEKRNRARARLKFLVANLGLDEFKRLVAVEKEGIPADERWSAFLDDLGVVDEEPSREGVPLGDAAVSADLAAWRETNVEQQKERGYVIATISLPLGDLSSEQGRALASIARTFNGGLLRTTVEQNVVLRWISEADLPDLHADLVTCNLAEAGAATLVDITACPGTDTCKLGISSSRGLAAELRKRIAACSSELDAAVRGLKIKISGCFNSCGQHHIADIGFYGVSRKVGGHTVPHFQLVLGGQTVDNAAAYGLATVAIPSKRIPEVVDRLTEAYIGERDGQESFQDFVRRTGKAKLRTLLEDLIPVPAHSEDASYYSDWGDPREYTIGDLGIGECAGEVVSIVEFGLSSSERIVFEALDDLEGGDADQAAAKARDAMLQAAKAITQSQNIDVTDNPDDILDEFRSRFYDTEIFFDPFAGAKFANYLFKAHDEPLVTPSPDQAHRRIEEAQLFIEAAHACYNKLTPV
ncbi:MAG: nitrite/sulfite reductase [Acidobacteriota bacterium]|nr:nitrite/sulfite reductase [Acidobacteriota bacterium]